MTDTASKVINVGNSAPVDRSHMPRRTADRWAVGRPDRLRRHRDRPPGWGRCPPPRSTGPWPSSTARRTATSTSSMTSPMAPRPSTVTTGLLQCPRPRLPVVRPAVPQGHRQRRPEHHRARRPPAKHRHGRCGLVAGRDHPRGRCRDRRTATRRDGHRRVARHGHRPDDRGHRRGHLDVQQVVRRRCPQPRGRGQRDPDAICRATYVKTAGDASNTCRSASRRSPRPAAGELGSSGPGRMWTGTASPSRHPRTMRIVLGNLPGGRQPEPLQRLLELLATTSDRSGTGTEEIFRILAEGHLRSAGDDQGRVVHRSVFAAHQVHADGPPCRQPGSSRVAGSRLVADPSARSTTAPRRRWGRGHGHGQALRRGRPPPCHPDRRTDIVRAEGRPGSRSGWSAACRPASPRRSSRSTRGRRTSKTLVDADASAV